MQVAAHLTVFICAYALIAIPTTTVNGDQTGNKYFSLIALLGLGTADSSNHLPAGVEVETRSLDQMYQAALAEGGTLVVYAGGDVPNQRDDTKAAFEKRFPGIKIEIIVDFSKIHGPRIDYQLATNSVVFDVTTLQTLQDFPRWKKQGVLLKYKPIGWDQVYDEFKDRDGAYTAYHIFKFSNLVNVNLMPNASSWPIEARDYLRSEFRDQVIVTYPHDDDAILFWFKQIVDKYGCSFVKLLQKQNLTLIRSTEYPYDWVDAGHIPFAMLSEGAFNPQPGSTTRFNIPKNDPFITWPQTAAIFKASKHPEAAKLFLSWLLDNENQVDTWSVRKDVPPPAGWKKVWDYKNTDPTAFARFMADRAAVETFKMQMSMIFGEVQGVSPTGQLGTNPTEPILPFLNPFNSSLPSCEAY